MVTAAIKATETTPRGCELSISRLSHRFALEGAPLDVLRNIDIDVAPGEFVAFLGASGCGKSTLLRLVAGLESPSEGEILCDGEAVSGPDPRRIIVLQDPTLYPWRKVYGNVSLGLEARGVLKQQRGRVGETLRLVGLSDFANAYPHQLSGGMAQRVALARVLINQPNLLLLDEPLGKLDSLTRMTMQGELLDLWKRTGFTALLVTHDVEEAVLLATRVLVLSTRPASIQAEIVNPLSYPRHRDDPQVIHLRRLVLEHLSMDNAL